jgi:glycosyltransferase involved in cell wall biosynthesis/GT2 family glycosyltransferase
VPPIVSVNTCTFNSARFVSETLRSVFAQTLQDFEVVIVDDGSTDGTPELIERDFPDARIKIVRQQHVTLRFARAIALAHSTGEFIAFLDSDDTWKADKLARQVEMARSLGEPALIFCDADLIDADSRPLGRRFSDQFDYPAIDLRGTNGYMELLRRGNFIASPTPFISAEAIRNAGGFNLSYRHVNDFELWLRLARRHRLVFMPDALACYREHDAQFTQRRMDVTLPEQCALLDPIVNSSSFPPAVRLALGDNLLGQHRLAARTLFRQRRYLLAARAGLGMLRYPDRLLDCIRHSWAGRIRGRLLEASVAAWRSADDAIARTRARIANGGRQLRARAAHVSARIDRAVSGKAAPPAAAGVESRRHVWIDGTCLHREQSGYFNLLVELIRNLAGRGDCVVHVTTNRKGRAALLSRVSIDPSRVQFHACGWRALHWSEIHNRVTRSTGDGSIARLIRIAWRWWPRPTGRTPTPNTVEVLFWRGRFRFRDAHRVAIVQDMTTRLHPEWHTPGNVREFDEFLRYVQQHAHAIATVSECSRRDIVERLAVPPSAVSVLPMPINPHFIWPSFDRGWLTLHRITTPYVLTVGTIEPRKNLRRLIRAFEWLRESDTLRDHTLVVVGAAGWDPGFHRFLADSDAAARVVPLGFVPTEHLPSLYHYASAVVQPSLYEGFGIPVMEAMCSSAVVIASSAGSLPEVLGPGGITFDPQDSRAIAAALHAALALGPAAARDYRRHCRAKAEAHLDRLRTEAVLPGLAPLADLQPT